LFGVILKTASLPAVSAMVDSLRWFKIGASWGGFESLVTNPDPRDNRSATAWSEPDYLLRLNIGLEAVEDLTADLEQGFARLNAAL
jgi:cystathionine beta-lyase